MFDRRNNLSELVAADVRGVLRRGGLRDGDPAQRPRLRGAEPRQAGAALRPAARRARRPMCGWRPRCCGASGSARHERRVARGLGRGLAALLGEQSPAPAPPRTSLPVTALEPGPVPAAHGAWIRSSCSDLTESIRAAGRAAADAGAAASGQAGALPDHRRRAPLAGGAGGRAARGAGAGPRRCRTPRRWRPRWSRTCSARTSTRSRRRRATAGCSDEFGLTQDALGDLVGKSRSHVANTMRLLQLPDPVRTRCRRARCPPGTRGRCWRIPTRRRRRKR